MQEFDMYEDKLEHDERYQRSAEFIELLRGAWSTRCLIMKAVLSGGGLQLNLGPLVTQYFRGDRVMLLSSWEPHSIGCFNGGSLEMVSGIIERVESATSLTGRKVRFAVCSALCRNTDEEVR